MSILWIFGGRQLSLFLDRFGTVDVMEAIFVLSTHLEKAERRQTRYALAVRTIFLFDRRLGERLHDARRFDRLDSRWYRKRRSLNHFHERSDSAASASAVSLFT